MLEGPSLAWVERQRVVGVSQHQAVPKALPNRSSLIRRFLPMGCEPVAMTVLYWGQSTAACGRGRRRRRMVR
eukprot:2393517-Pleurochrysis_carterae.AAC.2